MNFVYIDKLCLPALLKLAGSRVKFDRIYYFSAAPRAKRQAAVLRRFGLLKAVPESPDFSIGEVLDETGESCYLRIIEDANRLAKAIKQEKLVGDWLLEEFGRHLDVQKLLQYVQRNAAEDIAQTVELINIARWHGRLEHPGQQGVIMFMLRRCMWADHLGWYASGLGLRVLTYRTMAKGNYAKYVESLKRRSALTLKLLPGRLVGKARSISSRANVRTTVTRPSKNSPAIAALYTARVGTFERTKHSGFFWLLRSESLFERCLIYFGVAEIPATQSVAEAITGKGMSVLALSSGATQSELVPVWQTGSVYKRVRAQLLRALSKTALTGLLRFKRLSLSHLACILKFIFLYAWWSDFFVGNNVKININHQDYISSNIPMNLALEKNGGVSISYQYANWDVPTVLLSSSVDVMFAFAPVYEPIWRASDSNVGQLVYSGYITDHAFAAIEKQSMELRQKLTDAGAQFIIAYFDENSSDDRMDYISNKRSSSIYARFMQLVLEDKTLGLIFKPKRPDTLYSRLSSVTDLIEQAKATGRCLFMEEPDLLPCAASKAADLSIGLLIAGTAVLESYLSGTRSVFLDLEKLYSNPVYDWGKGKVVFDNLDDLFGTMAAFRHSPESMLEFGNLLSWAKDRDVFKDGNASLRVGRYIQWLLERFDNGSGREEAMRYANKRYIQAWGKEYVITLKAGKS